MISENQSSLFQTRYGEVSGVQAEKIQRLRVNRVAIVQVLKVEHVLSYLADQQIITSDEKNNILSGKTSQDKARKLIDILPNKGRTIDWYRHFREALLNPETRNNDVKKKYQTVIDFLENTILPSRVTSNTSNGSSCSSQELTFPRYEPLPEIQSPTEPMKNRAISHVTFELSSPDIQDLEDQVDEENGTIQNSQNTHSKPETLRHKQLLLKGFFQKWMNPPENFTSLVKEPTDHFAKLKNSTEPADNQQLLQEQAALQNLRNLEVVLVLNRRQKLPEGFEVCMSSVAEDFLGDSSLFHLYLKYIQELTLKHNLNIPLELSVSFSKLVAGLSDASDKEGREYVVKVGFGLFHLLSQHGRYQRAEQVMRELVVFLSQSADIESWMATWEAFVKLMTIRNMNMNFSESDAVYRASIQVADKIKLMSFGKDLLDESEMFLGLSTLMREQGSIASSYKWAQEALKEVDTDNHHGIVEVLCHASLAYGNKLYVKRAEELAVQAIRCARKWFGTRHPLYVKALLHYCHFSSEFRQDDMGVSVARKARDLCDVIYGEASTIQKAEAQQALAKALIVNQQFTNEEYFDCAKKAWRMALDVHEGMHPKIALFRFTLAQSLLWRATHSHEEDTSTGFLVWAETEATSVLSIFRAFWGVCSLKLSQGNCLLGQIYTKLGKPDEAEAILKANLDLHLLSHPRHSHYTHLARATLGHFYKTIDKPVEALVHLQKVVDTIECNGAYVQWVHVCFDTVIELLNAINRKKDADLYQDSLVDWMRKHPKPSQQLTWEVLDAEPQSFETFYEKINTWGTKLKAAKRGLQILKLSANVDCI